MKGETIKRISRLIAILTELQSDRISTAAQLAEKFSVSTRTIYRDIRTLEEAGVPVVIEEGRGFSLMEHYRLPPVSFTENEANALITAEQLVLTSSDTSLSKAYREAVTKIKAVLRHSMKSKANLLAERVQVLPAEDSKNTTESLTLFQFALTNYFLVKMSYTNRVHEKTSRIVEPFALLSAQSNWLVLAWCRLRGEFRFFRLDRITRLEILSEQFEPHQMTLQQYFEKYY